MRLAVRCGRRMIPMTGFGRPQRQSRYGLQVGIASDASCSGCLLPRDDHDARRRVLEDEVDRLAEDRALRATEARRAEHDDLRLAPLRLTHDRSAWASGAQQPPDHIHPVELADCDRSVERLVRLSLGFGKLGVEGQLERYDD